MRQNFNWDKVKELTKKTKFGYDSAIDALPNFDSSCDIKDDDYGSNWWDKRRAHINCWIDKIDEKLIERNSDKFKIRIRKLRTEWMELKNELVYTETSQDKLKIQKDKFLKLWQKSSSMIFRE